MIIFFFFEKSPKTCQKTQKLHQNWVCQSALSPYMHIFYLFRIFGTFFGLFWFQFHSNKSYRAMKLLKITLIVKLEAFCHALFIFKKKKIITIIIFLFYKIDQFKIFQNNASSRPTSRRTTLCVPLLLLIGIRLGFLSPILKFKIPNSFFQGSCVGLNTHHLVILKKNHQRQVLSTLL